MENTKAPLSLGTDNTGKLLMQYAIPAIIAMTAASLYNITDSIFIGHGVGSLALSGLAITFPLMNLAAAVGTLTGIGCSTLLSMRLGQKDYESANNILGNVITLNIILGLAFSILMLIFLDPILYFFGASTETLNYAHDFMVIILCGNVVTHMYFGLNALLRSAGSPQKSMYATIYAVLINLVLNPLFIFGFKWGIQGSALATVISQIIVLIWQINIFRNKNYFIHLKKGIYRLRKNIVMDSLAIGLSPFLMNAAACVIVTLINHALIKYGGDLAVGAYGIINRVAFLFVMVALGITQGMQPIIGYNYGAGLQHRVLEVLKKSIFWATVTMVVGTVIVEIFPLTVASIFTNDRNLTDIAAVGLRIIFISYPLVGFQIVVSNFFQSIGMARKSIFLSLTRQVLLLIPCLLILPPIMGTMGVWISMPMSDFISIIMASIMLVNQLRKFKKRESSSNR